MLKDYGKCSPGERKIEQKGCHLVAPYMSVHLVDTFNKQPYDESYGLLSPGGSKTKKCLDIRT